MSSASIAVEVTKFMTGKSSAAQLCMALAFALAVDVVLSKEVNVMLIYIPEGYTIWIFMILIAFAIIAPLFVGMFFKNESKYAEKPWTARYVATLMIDMAITPSLGIIAMSLIVQTWFPNMDPIAYLVLLPIVLIIVAYLALKMMNEGIKAVVEQVKGVSKEAQEAYTEVQQIRPKV